MYKPFSAAWDASWFVGRTAPYTGTVGARITDLTPGYARAELRDRRKVRNHLNSIHAVALANLTELAGSLSIIASMHPDTRMIPVKLETEYVKKARGTLTAEGSCKIPEPEFEGELHGTTESGTAHRRIGTPEMPLDHRPPFGAGEARTQPERR